ncbi:MAG: hypothetical protein WBA89_04150, partial [Microcoleus sp.]|uniref:hypothetical protein n=1 Tax=Microcoleus sp. TaxID=44472 RepID=UPI003C78F594
MNVELTETSTIISTLSSPSPLGVEFVCIATTYTNFKKECNSILVPPQSIGGARGGQRMLHDFRKMVL